MCKLKSLQTITAFRFFSNNVKYRIYELGAFCVMAFRPVITSTALSCIVNTKKKEKKTTSDKLWLCYPGLILIRDFLVCGKVHMRSNSDTPSHLTWSMVISFTFFLLFFTFPYDHRVKQVERHRDITRFFYMSVSSFANYVKYLRFQPTFSQRFQGKVWKSFKYTEVE